jgi:DNA-binding SARP family transcriptional activator
LCFLLWPDTPESAARRKLSVLLSHLRRTLPTPELLVTDDDRVWLEPDRTWSDTVVFDQTCTRASALERAVDLYRGPFLDGFSLPDGPEFEMWAALERQTWERRYLDAVATLIEESAANGDLDTAISWAQRYLAVDELAEDIHRRLIELYAAAGDRRSALRQFEECVAVLERELGVPPLPETQDVYRAILDARSLPRTPLAPTLGWTTLPSLDVSLVGRRASLRHLERAYDQARAGRGRLVLISGEPGVGKSRLMQEFASGLPGEARVLAAAGYQDTQTTPYQPIVEALRPALRANCAWPDAPRCCLSEASQLLPELRTLYPDLEPPPRGGEKQARGRLFEALCNLTLALAVGPHALVLCLDDLQWADSTTLDWLAYLGRRIRDSRLLVVGTYRAEDAGALAVLRHTLNRLGNLTELKLRGLDEAAVLEVVRSVHRGSRVPGDKPVAARLAQVTGGNPFFLLEVLRALLESGRPMTTFSQHMELPLPDTILDVVETRIERLSSKAQQVLEAGAILGQAFALKLVHRTSGRGEMETIDGLDELVARHLLREEMGRYHFCHELIRVAVYRGLSYWRRRVLHRRAGEALEELQPGSAAVLAQHFERAEELGRAAQYALQAGREAKTVFAHVEARGHFDQALALLKQEAVDLQEPEARASNQRLQIEAYYERGWALRLLGDMGTYARDLEEVASLAESLGDPVTLAHLRWREAYTHRWFCRYPQARRAAEEGVRLSQVAGDLFLEAQCSREIGIAARERGDYERAKKALERSLFLFTGLGEAVYQVHTLGNLATLHWYLGEYADSMSLSYQALKICDEAGLPLQRRLPLGDLGAAAAALSDADLAQRCLEESLSIAQETDDRTQEILCLLHLGWLCIRRNKPAEGLEHLRAGVELAERIGSCAEQSWLLCGLAEAGRLAGDQEQAMACAGQALELARATGRPYAEGLARRILSRLEDG